MKGKKAFVNPIAIMVSYLVFLAIWFVALAEIINTWSQYFIELNSLTGIEAFLVANLNFWIFILSLMAVIAGVYFSGE